MLLRDIIKKIPGAQSVYHTCKREQARLRRAIMGPDRAERYDIQTIEVLHRVLTADSVCVDVGAHAGVILRELVAIAPQGRHHAIEALPHLAARLEKEFPTVKVHACAVADETGQRPFNYVESAPAYSGLRKRRYDHKDVTIRQISVPVRRIDELVGENCQIRLMKLDIEGGEYHALLGAKKTLRRCRPIVIFEFGLGGADQYNVTPSMMFSLLADEAGLRVSTMERWLARRPAFNLAEFSDAFEGGRDFYYIAYPPETA